MKIALLNAAIVGGAMGGATATAQAACGVSTPRSVVHHDSYADGEGGLAPEIGTVTASVDQTCGYSVNPGILQNGLVDGDWVFVFIDRDGNSATGVPNDGSDIVVGTRGYTGADSPPLMGTWDGSTFQFGPTPVGPATSLGGFTASVDRLGIPAATNTRFKVAAFWEGPYADYFDFAPEVGSIGLGVNYLAPAPPPPPPPPAPVAAAPAPAPVSTTPAPTASCRVPSTKRLRFADAERKLRNAGCSGIESRRVYSSTVKAGRVVKTSPRAGVWTDDTVVVYVSRGRKKARRARASMSSQVARLEAMTTRLVPGASAGH